MKTIHVLVADDHPLFRHGVRTLLSTAPDMEVVGEAASGEEAVAMAEALSPDVVLMDIRMPGLNGIEATVRISRNQPTVHILVLTMFEDDASVFTAMRSGAKGYILKDADKDELLRAIRAVADGQAIFSPGIAAKMMDYFSAARPAASATRFPALSEREREVLYFMADGSGNADIAERLGISGKTVANYIANILNKLHIADREEAIRLAKQSRLEDV